MAPTSRPVSDAGSPRAPLQVAAELGEDLPRAVGLAAERVPGARGGAVGEQRLGAAGPPGRVALAGPAAVDEGMPVRPAHQRARRVGAQARGLALDRVEEERDRAVRERGPHPERLVHPGDLLLGRSASRARAVSLTERSFTTALGTSGRASGTG